MHDPQTVAHEIKYPWWKHKPWPKKFRDSGDRRFSWRRMQNEGVTAGRDSFWENGYRNTFVTIWHVDPEKDGSDDSCGWAWPKLTKAQREILRNAAWHEGSHPHFLCCNEKEWDGTLTEIESLYRGLALLVDRVLGLKLSWNEICRYAAQSTHIRDVVKAGSTFCFVAGYHTNFKEDRGEDRREHFHRILCGVARSLIGSKRPWWKHPKWHFWHWKIQCHPSQDLKRFLFTRCSKCGRRFKFGESVCTNSWYGKGPRWFRGEKDVYHHDCMGDAVPSKQSEVNTCT